MRDTPIATRAIQRAFFKDSCIITEPARPDAGVLDRATGVVTFPEPAEVYRGPCHVTSSPRMSFARQGEQARVVDEMRVSIRECELVRVDYVMQVRRSRQSLYEEWIVVRVPHQTMAFVTHLIIRRATARAVT